MSIHHIPVVVVSYNTPDLLRGLLASFRQYYSNPVHVVDGSDPEPLTRVRWIVSEFDNVVLHALEYNIHHGPGMAWAIQNLPFSGPVLFLDSDIVILREGFLEALRTELGPADYGVGGVNHVNQEGFNIEYSYGAVPCLQPPCMLCNIEVMRQWPLPVKHGSPMIAPMRALQRAGKSNLLRHLEWTLNDITKGTKKVYVDHIGQGTVVATGSYHLDEWWAEVQARRSREATQPAPTGFNPDLMAMIPVGTSRILEIGCSTGALAFAYKANYPYCSYHGVEIDDHAAAIARRYCDQVSVLDMDTLPESYFSVWSDRDCWLFGDVLEHLRDPWRILSHIYKVMPSGSCIVASVPNAQHWSLQAKLSVGDFRYTEGGLFDRTHLRWFTRVTLLEMFTQAGFRIDSAVSRIFNEPQRELVLPAIRAMAQSMGGDPEQAEKDALALQYVVRAVRP